MEKISVQIIREGAKLPRYASAMAAGADLCACLDGSVTIAPGQTVLIPTGIAVAIPEGFAGLIYARSGLAAKRDLAPANKVGVIDADYRGEIFVPLHNHGSKPQTLEDGERIAQMIVAPYLTAEFVCAESLPESARGTGGFGSTGTK